MKKILLIIICSMMLLTRVHAEDDRCHVINSTTKAIACNIYYESRSEPLLGKIAVGWVVMNRLKSDKFPDSPRQVTAQPGQFRWYRKGQVYKPVEREQWKHALFIAREIIAGRVRDPTKGALFFDQQCPSRSTLYKVVIGKHCFRSKY